MASKLFRAVVGFGIGLGATSAACFGATDDGGIVGSAAEAEAAPDGSTSTTVPSPPSSGSSTAPDPDPGPTANDAAPDVKVVTDAGVDAPKDVGADAFCDVAWPTTKGGKLPACSDPTGECADAGHPSACVSRDDAGACDWSSGTYAPICVNAEWRCGAGRVRGDQCL